MQASACLDDGAVGSGLIWHVRHWEASTSTGRKFKCNQAAWYERIISAISRSVLASASGLLRMTRIIYLTKEAEGVRIDP